MATVKKQGQNKKKGMYPGCLAHAVIGVSTASVPNDANPSNEIIYNI